LTLYLIFDKDFSKEVTAKAFNKNNLERGRTKITIIGKSGDARYFDFEFDKRTDLGFRNKITIE
jgi:hypothetical protein